MTLHTDIIDWSRSRPLWQQDALRRMAQGPTTRDDFDQIIELARFEYGLVKSTALKPITLASVFENGLGPRPEGDVRLFGIRDLTGVNALVSGQSIEFGDKGVTVVYGDNGAGKSGYTRVLKQACRARSGRPRIYANIYGEAVPQSATITYRVGQNDQVFLWHPESDTPRELREVSIFDSLCAAVYIGEDSDVAYLPYGTDLFPRLSRICDNVRAVLDDELQALRKEFDRWADFASGTSVYQLLQKLETSYSTCKALAVLSDADIELLARLRLEKQQRSTANPAGRAIELRQAARRISDIAHRWGAAADALSGKQIKELKAGEMAHAASLNATAATSLATFADAPISGLGSTSWLALWRSARAFAVEGSAPALEFPPKHGEVCVLCLQPLKDDTAAALARFDAFVQGHLYREAEAYDADVRARKAVIHALVLENVANDADVQQVTTLDPNISAALIASVKALESRRDCLLAGDYDGAMAVVLDDPRSSLESAAAKLVAEAIVLEGVAQAVDLTGRDALLAELESREQLASAAPRLDAQLERESQAARLTAAVASTNTMMITKFSRELLASVVTAPLAAAFAKQCESLRLRHIPTSLQGIRGEKGTALHRLSIQHEADDVAKEDVLSEGEHRCIALASYLAEVSIQESMSTLVLDDPVSSLDHGRRTYVAHELASIAASRPVVVFTHDLVFLWMLQGAADSAGVPCTHWSMRRASTAAGFISNDPPWDGLRIKRRISIMKEGLAKLGKLAETNPALYEAQIRLLYGRLRDSWERAVEEVLLQEAIQRFAPEVKTQALRKLHRVTEEQMDALEAGMTKASAWIQGHDHAAGLGAVVPTPSEALADIAALEDWITSLRKTFER